MMVYQPISLSHSIDLLNVFLCLPQRLFRVLLLRYVSIFQVLEFGTQFEIHQDQGLQLDYERNLHHSMALLTSLLSMLSA